MNRGALDFCIMVRRNIAAYWVALCIENGGRLETRKAVMERLKEAIAYFREAYETESCIYSPALIIE